MCHSLSKDAASVVTVVRIDWQNWEVLLAWEIEDYGKTYLPSISFI